MSRHCWGKKLQRQQVGKEGLIPFLNPHKFPVSQTFSSFGAWGRNTMVGQPLITSWQKTKTFLLFSEALLPQSIPFSLPLLSLHAQASLSHMQPSAVLGLLALGTKTQGQGQHKEATWVSASQSQVKGGYGCKKNQNHTFRKERERIQETRKNYTNWVKDTKIAQPKPRP